MLYPHLGKESQRARKMHSDTIKVALLMPLTANQHKIYYFQGFHLAVPPPPIALPFELGIGISPKSYAQNRMPKSYALNQCHPCGFLPFPFPFPSTPHPSHSHHGHPSASAIPSNRHLFLPKSRKIKQHLGRVFALCCLLHHQCRINRRMMEG
jgi:hypothetical protein